MIEERHHQGCGKGAWSKAGVIRGSDQVDKLDRIVMCSRDRVI